MQYIGHTKAQEMTMKPSISNGVLITTLIIVFPIGLLLFLWRLLAHTNRTYLKIKDCKIGGNSCLIILALVLLPILGTMHEAGFKDSLTALAIFLGLPCMTYYLVMWSMASRLRDRKQIYKNLVTVKGVTSINDIAHRVKMRNRVVYFELILMIAQRELPGCHIDYKTLQIVPNIESESKFMNVEEYGTHGVNVNYNQTFTMSINMDSTPPPHTSTTATATLLPKTVACPNCGASVQLKPDSSQPCEYCGTVLEYI